VNDIIDEIVKLANRDVEYYDDKYIYKVDHISAANVSVDNDEYEVSAQVQFLDNHIDYTARRLDKIKEIL
jgi:hypothetical protein